MTDVPARDLRNDVSGVLRRVESGERLRVTVSGRPVAELVPLPTRRQTMPWAEFRAMLAGGQADAALRADLREWVPDSTDDVPVSR
jgi:prevent-host-death family protein